MWSSIKSSIKSAASEIVREAEEREKREKVLVHNISSEDSGLPTETAASFFDSQPRHPYAPQDIQQRTGVDPAQAQAPSYDDSTQAIDFFSTKPSEVQAEAAAFTSFQGMDQSYAMHEAQPSHLGPNDPTPSTINENGHSEANPPGFDSIDLFNEPKEDPSPANGLEYANGSDPFARRDLGLNRQLSSPSSDRIEFDPNELEQVDLNVPGEPTNDMNHVEHTSYSTTTMTTPMSKVEVAESPLSQAMRGTFQHLNKLKAMTTSAMSSTLPLQSMQEPAEAKQHVFEAETEAEAKQQLFENMRKAKSMMVKGGDVLAEDNSAAAFCSQVDEELEAFWQAKQHDITNQRASLPASKKENEQHNGMDALKLKLSKRHEEELGRLREQQRTVHGEMEAERSQVAKDRAEYKQRLEQAMAKNSALFQECETLLDEKTNLQQLVNGKDQEIQSLQQELERSETRMETSQRSVQAEVNEELSRTNGELEALRGQVGSLEAENIELQRLLREKMEDFVGAANASLEAKRAEFVSVEKHAESQQRDVLALRSIIAQKQFEKEAVQREIDAFNESTRSVQRTIDELKAVERSLCEEGAITQDDASESELLQGLFNDNVAKALQSTLASTPSSSLEQAKTYAQVRTALQQALLDALSARLKQRSLEDNPMSTISAEVQAKVEHSRVDGPLDLVRSAATLLRMVSSNNVDMAHVLQRLAPFEATLKDKSMEELEELAQQVTAIRSQAFGDSEGLIELKENVGSEIEAAQSSSVEEFVAHTSRVLSKQHRLNKALEDSLAACVREILRMAAALLSGAAKWALDSKSDDDAKPAEDDTTCDRRLAANVVTICIERNCRRDCLEVVARVLEFDAEQRKRVGLDTGGGFWSAFIPNLSRGQAKAEQVNMEEQSLSSLLQDFIIDETS